MSSSVTKRSRNNIKNIRLFSKLLRYISIIRIVFLKEDIKQSVKKQLLYFKKIFYPNRSVVLSKKKEEEIFRNINILKNL